VTDINNVLGLFVEFLSSSFDTKDDVLPILNDIFEQAGKPRYEPAEVYIAVSSLCIDDDSRVYGTVRILKLASFDQLSVVTALLDLVNSYGDVDFMLGLKRKPHAKHLTCLTGNDIEWIEPYDGYHGAGRFVDVGSKILGE